VAEIIEVKLKTAVREVPRGRFELVSNRPIGPPSGSA